MNGGVQGAKVSKMKIRVGKTATVLSHRIMHNFMAFVRKETGDLGNSVKTI